MSGDIYIQSLTGEWRAPSYAGIWRCGAVHEVEKCCFFSVFRSTASGFTSRGNSLLPAVSPTMILRGDRYYERWCLDGCLGRGNSREWYATVRGRLCDGGPVSGPASELVVGEVERGKGKHGIGKR